MGGGRRGAGAPGRGARGRWLALRRQVSRQAGGERAGHGDVWGGIFWAGNSSAKARGRRWCVGAAERGPGEGHAGSGFWEDVLAARMRGRGERGSRQAGGPGGGRLGGGERGPDPPARALPPVPGCPSFSRCVNPCFSFTALPRLLLGPRPRRLAPLGHLARRFLQVIDFSGSSAAVGLVVDRAGRTNPWAAGPSRRQQTELGEEGQAYPGSCLDLAWLPPTPHPHPRSHARSRFHSSS